MSLCPGRREGKHYKDASGLSPFKREDALDAHVNHVISEVYAAQKDCAMYRGRKEAMSQVTLKEATTGSPCSIEDVVTAFVTCEGRIVIRRTDTSLKVILQRSVHETLNKRLIFVVFECRPLQKI